MSTLSTRLKEARAAASLTQEQLAKAAKNGLTANDISKQDEVVVRAHFRKDLPEFDRELVCAHISQKTDRPDLITLISAEHFDCVMHAICEHSVTHKNYVSQFSSPLLLLD